MAPTGYSHVLILLFSGDEDMIVQLRACKSHEIARDYQVKGAIIRSIVHGKRKEELHGRWEKYFYCGCE
jgi:hypothetical protein